jgi:hypothetical protein
MDWIDLAQDRDKWRALVNTVMKITVGNFLSSCTTGGFSRKVQFRIVIRLLMTGFPSIMKVC